MVCPSFLHDQVQRLRHRAVGATIPVMGSRLVRIFAAFLWLLWFTAVAPLHQRGIITVDGSGKASAACCEHKDQSHHAPDAPAQKCAVCFTLAIAGTNPGPDVTALAPQETRHVCDDLICAPYPSLLVDAAHCRGPPAV